MIKPDTLYNFGKMCSDPVVAGHVLMALCKQKIELTPMEQVIVNMVKQDSEWMEERIEANRVKMRERQKAHRAKSTDVTPVTECHSDICDKGSVTPVTECHGDICDKDDVTPVTHHPSIHPSNPSIHPSNPNIKHRTGTDTCACAREGGSSGSGTGRGEKFDLVMGWEPCVVYGGGPNGDMTALDMYHAAFGPGWSGIRRQLGERADERMLDELATFISEWKANENHNLVRPAGAIMKRLQRWLKPKGGQQ